MRIPTPIVYCSGSDPRMAPFMKYYYTTVLDMVDTDHMYNSEDVPKTLPRVTSFENPLQATYIYGDDAITFLEEYLKNLPNPEDDAFVSQDEMP